MSRSLRAFLMSDIEDSNTHWASQPRAMTEAVASLDDTVGAVVSAHGGVLLKARGEGDSHFAVFGFATDAVLAGCALQDRLSEPIESLEIQARIAIHVGEVEAISDDYYGTAVNQTARLRAAAHGGQTVVSHVTALLAEPSLADRVVLRTLGYHRIRDFPHVEEVFQASWLGDDRSFPPLRTGETHGPALMAVAIVDICGATAAVGELNDPAVMALHREWAALMRALGDAHHATIVKSLGDGCLAAFEDPLDSLAFTRAFQQAVAAQGLQIKAGIDVGRVELTDGEILGTVVYRAFGLERGAARGEIALSPLTRELAGISGSEESPGPLDSSTDRASGP